MQQLWDMKEIKQFFNVKDTRTIIKFIHNGLPCFKIGAKDYRFDPKDVERFVETQKEINQEELNIKPIKRKSKTMNIDFQKRKINLEMNRVV